MPVSADFPEKIKSKLPLDKRPLLALSLIVVAIVFLLLLLSFRAKPEQPKYPPVPTPVAKPTSFKQTVWTVMATREIFVPKVTTITQGSQVSFINLAGSVINIAASPSSSSEYLKLTIGEIANGQGVMTKFETKGTYVFYNKLYPKAVGTIIVK